MVDELRKEIQALKDRIAVLESRPILPDNQQTIILPTHPTTPHPLNLACTPYCATCRSDSASLTDLK